LAAAVCYETARYLNKCLVAELGENGIVYMAAHYGLLADDPISSDAYRSPEAVVCFLLGGRYRILKLEPTEVIRALKAIDRWSDCKKSSNNERKLDLFNAAISNVAIVRTPCRTKTRDAGSAGARI
jgi:hypothetical protein